MNNTKSIEYREGIAEDLIGDDLDMDGDIERIPV